MRSYKTEGIVIKRKNFGEADRILTVFTKNKGKISVVAKGVRKINSRRSPHIELLNLSLITIHDGKMPILTEAETIKHYIALKSDLKKAGYAFYICELVDGLLAFHQENRAVLDLIKNTLVRMEETGDCRFIIAEFEQELLSLLGFWPREVAFIEDSDAFIEDIIERKIKSKRILQLF